MTITVIDKSHDYSMLLRFDANAIYHGATPVYWFDTVDNTEINGGTE